MKNNLRKIKVWATFVSLCFWMGCDDFLDTQPYGTTTLQTLSKQTSGAEALLIAAYSNLDGFSIGAYVPWTSSGSNWVYGSITGGDAYKGSDNSDQQFITWIETHKDVTPENPFLQQKWTTYYNGIARANDAIRAFQALNGISDEFRNMRIAEARFLRGFFHFELRKIFGWVPFIDETMVDVRVGNAVEIFGKIGKDFLYAADYLPMIQEQPGRITKGASLSYFGIIKMWEHDYDSARIYFDYVISSNQYKLNATYHENFNAEYRNRAESILEVQQSVNDGAQAGPNGNPGDWLNYPYAPGYCCGFHQPSQNLVNAFKTGDSGLPLLDTYNEIGKDVTSDEGLLSTDPFTPYAGNLDPRLDWTVGRREIPYLDWGKHPGKDWIRDQVFAGPYSPKKTIIYKSQESSYGDNTTWLKMLTANNLKLLRYADLLLYAAEAEVEIGNLGVAMELVNQVRNRAANPAGWVHTYVDPSNPALGFTDIPAANYFIKPYTTFPDKEFARKAVRFERRLELGMEGHRFFDLVRWGIAAAEKNKYFEKEKLIRSHLVNAHFQEGKNEFLPIPQKAIELSYKDGNPTLSQNHGY